MKNDVLIVDDDRSVIRTVKRILTRAGLNVYVAESGEECLNHLEKGFQGLILMDIIMPEMDGWDTIDEIVKRGLMKDIIICMLTGKDEPGERMESLKEYVIDYIRKPFNMETLVDVVKNYLSYLK